MFRQLGINFVQRGIYDVARSVDRLNLVFRSYSRTVQQAGKASVGAARDADQLAKTTIRSLTPAFNTATSSAFKFNDAIIRTKVSLGEYAKHLTGKATQNSDLRKSVDQLATKYIKLDTVQKELSKVENMSDRQRSARIGKMTRLRNEIAAIIIATGQHHQKEAEGLGVKKNVEKAIQALVVALAKQKVAMIDGAKFIKAYEEAVAKGKTETEAYAAALKASAQGGNKFQSAMTMVRNAVLATVSAVQAIVGAFNILIGIFTGLFNIAKAIISPILKLAKAIGTALLNALWSLIKLPFNILKSAFNTIWTSLQRIFDIVVGTTLSRGLQNLGNAFRNLGKMIFDAATEFQLVEIRLLALTQREFQAAGHNLADSMRLAKEETKELVNWVTKLSVQSIFEAEDILNMHALGMSYGFTTQMASELTEATLNFATGMGLSGVEMNRIIENFGQMRQQGKITGTELRDLARGAFVPVGAVLEQMGVDLEVISGIKLPSLAIMKDNLKGLAKEGKISNDELERMSKLLEDNTRGSTITATTLMKLAKSGELSEEAMTYLGTTLEAVGLAADDLTFAELTKELNELIKTGEASVDDFFIAFMNMVGKDFPDAMKNAASTMKIVRQNIKDFFVTMVGWRVVAPVVEIVAKRLTVALNKLLGDDVIKLFDDFGMSLQFFTKLLFGLFDAIKIPDLNLGFFDNAIKIFGDLFAVFSAINTGSWGALQTSMASLTIFLKGLGLETGTVREIRDAFEDLFDVFENMDDLSSDEIWERVKASLLAIFTPLWEEILQPELITLIENVKSLVVTKWETEIKPALNDFIQNVILPGLNEFITVTVPAWASTIGEHIPKIATAFGTTLYNALDAISTWAGNNTGVISGVVELLSNLGKYLLISAGANNQKPPDGAPFSALDNYMTKKHGAFEQSGLAESLNDLEEALAGVAEKGALAIANFFEPMAELARDNQHIVDLLDALSSFSASIAELHLENLGLIGDLFSALATIKSGGDNTGTAEGLTEILKVMTFINNIRAVPARIVRGIVDWATDLVLFLQKLDEIIGIWMAFKKPPSEMMDELTELFSELGEWDVPLWDDASISPYNDMLDGLDQFILDAQEKSTEIQEIGNEPLEKVPFTDMGTQAVHKVEEAIAAIEGVTAPLGDESMFKGWEDATIDGMQNVSDTLIMHSIIPDMITSILNYLVTNLPPLLVPVTNLLGSIVGAISGVNLHPVGEAMFQGMLDGMKLKLIEILLFIEDAAKQINEAWERAQQIGSPSKVWERLGLMTMAGLEKGIEKGFGRVLGITAVGMSSLRSTAGLTRGENAGNQYNYNNSMADNRNINVNYMNSNGNFALDYDYVRAIT